MGAYVGDEREGIKSSVRVEMPVRYLFEDAKQASHWLCESKSQSPVSFTPSGDEIFPNIKACSEIGESFFLPIGIFLSPALELGRCPLGVPG